MENQKEGEIVAFDGELLHPSIDIKENILTLGFRCRSDAYTESDIFLIKTDSNIQICRDNTFIIQNKNYFFETRERKLNRLEEKWGIIALKQLVAKFNNAENFEEKGRDIFEAINNLLHKYIELENENDYILLSTWILGTYYYQIFYSFPFLHIKAPKRSGKSQCLNLLTQLCFNAIKARPSLASLSDTVDSLRGTFLIDQCDALGRKGNEELLDTLADSYKRSGGKRRIVSIDKKKGRTILEFETYSPKVFASVKELPEDLADRCLIIPLVRSQQNFLDPDDNNENWREIRGKLYNYLILNYSIFQSFYFAKKRQYKENTQIKGRTLELWLPFEVVLNGFGMAEFIEQAKKRFLSQYVFTEYEPSEFEEVVLLAIIGQFNESQQIKLTPKEISETLDNGELPPEWTPQQKAAKVGWVIKKFNASSAKLPRSKKGMQYLFEKEQVEKVYQSYFNITNKPTSPALSENNPDKTGN